MRPARVLLLSSIALAAVGCAQLATAKRCRQLAQRVNPALEAIALSVGEPRTAQGYQKAAAGYEAVAKELDSFDAGAAELDRAVDDYASSLRTSGVHAGELAAALDGGNRESAALAAQQLEQVKHAQKSAVKRFEQECQGH